MSASGELLFDNWVRVIFFSSSFFQGVEKGVVGAAFSSSPRRAIFFLVASRGSANGGKMNDGLFFLMVAGTMAGLTALIYFCCFTNWRQAGGGGRVGFSSANFRKAGGGRV